MDKKNQLIVAIFLMMVAAFSIMANFLPAKGKKVIQPKAVVASTSQKVSLPDRTELADLVREDVDDPAQEILLKSKWGVRNPFDERALKSAEVVGAEPVATNLVVAGIVSGKVKPSTIINDKVFGVGDKVEGMTVKAIRPDVVILTNGQKETTLKIRQ